MGKILVNYFRKAKKSKKFNDALAFQILIEQRGAQTWKLDY